jgi:hypothetical protein
LTITHSISFYEFDNIIKVESIGREVQGGKSCKWKIIAHKSRFMLDGTPFSSSNGNQIASCNTSNVDCEFHFSCLKVVLHFFFGFFRTLQESLNNILKFIIHV